MSVKNEIEKLFVRISKLLRGRGPENVVVKVQKESILVTINGIASHLELEAIKSFPEYEDFFADLRNKLFQKKFNENKERFEKMICCRITGNDFKFDYKKDKAELCFKILPTLNDTLR